MNKAILIGSLFLAFQVQSATEKRITNDEYITNWSRTAMENMLAHKIPASITLAQGILESGSGNSDLARQANNHFGIKCHDWKGAKMYKDDDAKGECFRKYDRAELSFADHSTFLTTRSRYATLFTYKQDDYKAWAKGLKAAGYATNPKYPDLLIDLIERLELYKYDQLTLNSPNKGTNILVEPEVETKESKETNANTKVSEKNTGSKGKKTFKEKMGRILDRSDATESTVGNKRQTSLHDNKVKYVIATKGDTYYKLAEELQMTLAQIHKYNDVKNGNGKLKAGDIVNIHPKRSKGTTEYKTYTKEFTLLEISQMEGIKVESLMKINTVSSPQHVVGKGQKVALR